MKLYETQRNSMEDSKLKQAGVTHAHHTNNLLLFGTDESRQVYSPHAQILMESDSLAPIVLLPLQIIVYKFNVQEVTLRKNKQSYSSDHLKTYLPMINLKITYS